MEADMDDALSWEQRREIRRKKRQELLAESDRLVGISRERSSRDYSVEDDDFERERLKRRKEREERRKREREELEKQLQEEEEARLEREKKREERRRQREVERQKMAESFETNVYGKSAINSMQVTQEQDEMNDNLVKKEEELNTVKTAVKEQNAIDESENVVVEKPVEELKVEAAVESKVEKAPEQDESGDILDKVDDEPVLDASENNSSSNEDNVDSKSDSKSKVEDMECLDSEEEKVKNMGVEDSESDEGETDVVGENEPNQNGEPSSESANVSVDTKENFPKLKKVEKKLNEMPTTTSENEAMKMLKELKQKRQIGAEKKLEESKKISDDIYNKIEERRTEREKLKLEEETEKQHREEVDRKYQEKLRKEREAREQRRKELDEKKRENRELLNSAEEIQLASKSKNSTISQKVGQLNKQIENAKVKSVAVTPKMSENINSRMEKYSMSSNKNKEKQTSTQINITKNVSDTKNRWKSGQVYKKEEKKKTPNKAILGASLNKRKNIFENGKNQSQPTTTKQVAVGGISNRKEMYLKQAEDKKENKDSSQLHANKSSKLKQLDKWESGQVTSAKSPNKVTISISSSGVKDKMNKYKSLTQEN